MCVAVPAKVTEINDKKNKAKALVMGNELEVDISLVSPAIGDYVLVHAGCALEIVKEDAAVEMIGLFEEMEEFES